MIVKRDWERKFIAQATVPNGRWGDQWIAVELVEDDGRDIVIYRDGHSDPLHCDDVAMAMRFFNERIQEAA
jgi:hypothetical protein